MTSSLVGSEMCIRDRSWASVTILDTLPLPLLVVHVLEHRWRPIGGPEAVSYTHLTLPTICSV
eukprot:10007902-Prorocentrum_lima.AAC.1